MQMRRSLYLMVKAQLITTTLALVKGLEELKDNARNF
jgi:hypothetical protein